MPRPRAQLDTAALARAFAADGLHGTPIEPSSPPRRLAKPTLYARGGDKEELFALAVEAEVERLLDRFEGADRLSELARALDDHLREAPDGARLLLVTARHRSSRVASGSSARWTGSPRRWATRCWPARCSVAPPGAP